MNQFDNSELDLSAFEESPPSSSFIESVRSFGYTFNSAIADLIDNSITANASKIYVHVEFNSGEPWVTILDNGDGMDENNLKKNMIIGSRLQRDEQDLGRFGVGLKTASFAMARQLNVFSKTENTPLAFRSWDLDVVEKTGKWLIGKKQPNWYNKFPKQLVQTGTLIIWQKCDNIMKSTGSLKSVQQIGLDLIDHLGVVFCRFIEQKRIYLTVNGSVVKPWNPIHKRSRSLSVQTILGANITPYILPHHSRFKNREEYEETAGINGWTAQQGFYVYRNDRLIVNGGWLGFKKMKNDNHTTLARIILDINNKEDAAWEIDIRKSRASVPAAARKSIEGIAKHVRKEAENLARFKSKSTSREVTTNIFVWRSVKAIDGEMTFIINKDHPVLKKIQEYFLGNIADFDRFLKLLEKSLPTAAIQIEKNKNETVGDSEFTLDEVLELAKFSLTSTDTVGKSRKLAIEDLIISEPFSSYQDDIKKEFLP